MNVNTLTFSDSDYPACLRNIHDAPRTIYWAGRAPKEWIDRPKAAIVGSRKLTAYGKNITQRLAGDLAKAGVVIISGLAYGIDITAHSAALAERGTTVAVLPTGIDQIYPAAHAGTARHIAESGSLISEYGAGSIPFKLNFIARNRIVSGLADVLLITEAAVNSGSLHTARFAMEQGKTVMAVPGSITSPASEGCNNLIKSGAVPVTTADDIFFALKMSPQKPKTRPSFHGTDIEKTVYGLIKDGVSDQEQLASAAAADTPTLASTLTMLELSGHIRPAGAGSWIIS